MFNHWPKFVFLWQVLASSGTVNSLCEMPVVLIPAPSDRDQMSRIPSCQLSILLSPFCSHDFMTGVPAIPSWELPVDVSSTGCTISVVRCTYLCVLHRDLTGSCYITCMHVEGLQLIEMKCNMGYPCNLLPLLVKHLVGDFPVGCMIWGLNFGSGSRFLSSP